VGTDVSCGGKTFCSCLRDVNGATRCGSFATPGCNQCTTNADCAALTGEDNAFCVESGSNACCTPGSKMCRIPCPD
jgi:hypothetical protein